MTQAEKIELIALYDGWEKTGISRLENKGSLSEYKCLFRKSFTDSFRINNQMLENMPYLTDLNWLHPVAMKVLYHVSSINKPIGYRIYCRVFNHCASKPKDGQYIHLFEAVVCAIQFLNEQKQTTNETA
jgi:hypothetical protein